MGKEVRKVEFLHKIGQFNFFSLAFNSQLLFSSFCNLSRQLHNLALLWAYVCIIQSLNTILMNHAISYKSLNNKKQSIPKQLFERPYLDPNLKMDTETLILHSGQKFMCFVVHFHKKFYFWHQTGIVSKKVYAVIWPLLETSSLNILGKF